MRESLLQIGARLRSSKWGGKSYLPVYDELFKTWRDEPITIVEIGIDHGNSLQMWLEYFTKARIIGIDGCLEYVTWANKMHPRISAHHHLQQDAEVGRIMSTFAPTIIVDDASHDHVAEMITFNNCWQYIQPGGLYCIEDIQHAHEIPIWKHIGATVYAGYTSSEWGDYRYDDVLVVLRKEQNV